MAIDSGYWGNGAALDSGYWESDEDTNVPTNADHIRSMTDEELAEFMADKMANQAVLRLADEGTTVSETQRKVLQHRLAGTWFDWLKQPYKEEV